MVLPEVLELELATVIMAVSLIYVSDTFILTRLFDL